MHAATNTLTIRCPAKLNLTLAVGPARDDGMHPIASIMVALDFGDDLTLHQRDDQTSTFERRFADDAPKPQSIDWPIESDLAFRAHAMTEAHVGHPLPIDCKITKRIPAGAGLGGGSSNAAGMLVGLRQLFDLPTPDQDLLAIAKNLGADVTFQTHAILGQHAAFVSGTGESIRAIDTIPAFDCVLVFPDGSCSTPAVYRAFDQAQAPAGAIFPEDLFCKWVNNNTLPPPHNDLTEAAIQVCPAIRPTIQTITGMGFVPRLTGSGSALHAIVESNNQAIGIADALKQYGLAAQPAMFAGPSRDI